MIVGGFALIGVATGVVAQSKCTGGELKAAGKKASCKLGLYSKAAAKSLPVDTAKLASCTSKYTAAYAKAVLAGDCVTTVGQGTIETKVDNFVNDVNGELAPPGPTKLAFAVLPGTTSCGSAGYATTPPAAPASGNIDSDTACTTSVSALGLGCLSIGDGSATIVSPAALPDGSTSILNISGGTLSGAATGDRNSCTVGDGPGKHCINNNSMPACATDGNCGAFGACSPDANCLFGPPLPILTAPPFGSLTMCVLNVVHTSASGTANASTGASSIGLPLASRVYNSGNTASPCPRCLSGTCDPTWKTATALPSPDAGSSCVAVGSEMTSNDCRPALGNFQAAPLTLDLTPLTTGTSSMTDGSGLFCSGEPNAGAFGQGTVRCITETGQAAGNMTDQTPHNAHLVSVFCIPSAGDPALDNTAALPGPGAVSLNGNLQLLP